MMGDEADQVVGGVGESTYNIMALVKGDTSTDLVTLNACGQASPPMAIHYRWQDRDAMRS